MCAWGELLTTFPPPCSILKTGPLQSPLRGHNLDQSQQRREVSPRILFHQYVESQPHRQLPRVTPVVKCLLLTLSPSNRQGLEYPHPQRFHCTFSDPIQNVLGDIGRGKGGRGKGGRRKGGRMEGRIGEVSGKEGGGLPPHFSVQCITVAEEGPRT